MMPGHPPHGWAVSGRLRIAICDLTREGQECQEEHAGAEPDEEPGQLVPFQPSEHGPFLSRTAAWATIE